MNMSSSAASIFRVPYVCTVFRNKAPRFARWFILVHFLSNTWTYGYFSLRDQNTDVRKNSTRKFPVEVYMRIPFPTSNNKSNFTKFHRRKLPKKVIPKSAPNRASVVPPHNEPTNKQQSGNKEEAAQRKGLCFYEKERKKKGGKACSC